MLGDFITRCLILVLGYAYPGFECYKTVEKNRVDIEELRFWCQYWIIVALLTIVEKFADIFISWLPLYGEMKLMLIVYLWYPKTKGSGYVYKTLLRPYVAKHENEIDRKLLEWKARAWDLAIFYGQNCTQLGQTAFFQVLEYLATQSSRFSSNPIAQKNGVQDQSTPTKPLSFFENKQKNLSVKSKKSSSPPSSPSSTINRNISETPKSEKVQVHLDSKTEHVKEEEALDLDDQFNVVRARLRRLNANSPRTPTTPRSPQRREL